MIATRIGSSSGPTAGFIFSATNTSDIFKLLTYRKTILRPREFLTFRPDNGQFSVNYQNAAWSSNSDYLAIAKNVPDVQSTGLAFYQRNALTFTQKTVPSNFDVSDGHCAIASDGSYVAVASDRNPNGRIWFNNAGTLSVISNVGSFDAITSKCAVSSTGAYVAFLGSSTFLRIKIRSGLANSAVFSDMVLASQPASGAPSSGLGGLAFSPDDTYLAVCPANENDQTIYKWDVGLGKYVKLSSPFVGALPSNNILGCCFSPQGDVLAIAGGNGTFFYERTGDVFTSVANIPNSGQGNFHPSGNFYITNGGVIYKKNSLTNWVIEYTLGLTAASFSPFITT